MHVLERRRWTVRRPQPCRRTGKCTAAILVARLPRERRTHVATRDRWFIMMLDRSDCRGHSRVDPTLRRTFWGSDGARQGSPPPSALRGLDPRHALPMVTAFIGASATCSYEWSRGSMTWSVAPAMVMRAASGCAGLTRTLNVSGTMADGTVSSAVAPWASQTSPIARVACVFSTQSRSSSATEGR